MNDLDLDLVGLAWPAFFFLMLCSCCECNCVDAPHQYAVTTHNHFYIFVSKKKKKKIASSWKFGGAPTILPNSYRKKTFWDP